MREAPYVVLVLANLMSSSGILNAESSARVDFGCNLFNASGADYLFFIGWNYREDCDLAIADAMNAYQAEKWGIPQEKLIINRLSRDTVGDAVFSRNDLDTLFDSYRLSVVTSLYHLPRVRLIFEFVHSIKYGLSFHGVEVPTTDLTSKTERESIAAFKRTFEGVQAGDLPALKRRLTSSHPFYNGEAFPTLRIA